MDGPSPPAAPGDAHAAILRLATAYQGSRALHVAVRMGVVDAVARGLDDTATLASALGAHAPSLRRLLRALVAFGVLTETPDGRVGLAPMGQTLRSDVAGSARDLVLLWGDDDFQTTWGALEHCVRTGETAARHMFGASQWMTRYELDPTLLAVYSAGMATMALMAAEAVLATCDLGSPRRIVDVGGGEGRMLAALLRAYPGARGVVLDRPEVAARASVRLAEAGLDRRAEALGGDMFDGVPPGGDVYLLSRVLHDWNDAEATAILRHCREAMQPDARLLVIERVPGELGHASAEQQGHALSDLNMLVRTGGRERTAEEYAALLRAARLRVTRIVPTKMPWSVVEAAWA